VLGLGFDIPPAWNAVSSSFWFHLSILDSGLVVLSA